tara:strand:- start:10340 stop:10837 length:498 start_codon:yes stop_codon:yes gene_type:complete
MFRLRNFVGKEIFFGSHRGILTGYDRHVLYVEYYQRVNAVGKPRTIQRDVLHYLYDENGQKVLDWSRTTFGAQMSQVVVARPVVISLAEEQPWHTEENKIECPIALDKWLKRHNRKNKKTAREKREVVALKKKIDGLVPYVFVASMAVLLPPIVWCLRLVVAALI